MSINQSSDQIRISNFPLVKENFQSFENVQMRQSAIVIYTISNREHWTRNLENEFSRTVYLDLASVVCSNTSS